ncbi:hypothetical protein [Tropicimonas sediminicola]|uniref:Uncharacterized protein n=1 Tax=Tropicimonas sediminicola TaxID=1031541 RepID=A0A239EVQ6_9RHOB|nr:hypothetical protein [Tropicimonas sediminicola]SNS47914.1 hypothetical protein SAMN05421757_102323 [Tropicimonas sediminicola]
MNDDTPEILATITPSTPRRVVGIIILCTFGSLLVYVGVTRPPEDLLLQLFMLVVGGGGLALSEAMRRATAKRLELTETELRDSSGEVLARIDQIVAIDRGTFAIKPSNGFLLRLSDSAAGNHWAPGLWWRLGRRVGVGGITSASEAKVTSEILTALVARRAYEESTPSE